MASTFIFVPIFPTYWQIFTFIVNLLQGIPVIQVSYGVFLWTGQWQERGIIEQAW